MTKEEIKSLSNENLLKLLAEECGIYTENQLKAFFDGLYNDTDETMVTYGFAEWYKDGIVLNYPGIIAAEVVDRFMDENNSGKTQ